jgi:hypothetical protein
MGSQGVAAGGTDYVEVADAFGAGCNGVNRVTPGERLVVEFG